MEGLRTGHGTETRLCHFLTLWLWASASSCVRQFSEMPWKHEVTLPIVRGATVAGVLGWESGGPDSTSAPENSPWVSGTHFISLDFARFIFKMRGQDQASLIAW